MKNIILLSDGTGNGAAKRHKTNVWRLYEALDLHDKNQIVMYDDGVGSQDSTLLKVLGGAFGFGLERNVLELYKYLCRNYRDAEQNKAASKIGESDTELDEAGADRIYLFGFSRGAFTVRVLAGFIAHAGLCTHYNTEQELDNWARDNYRHYRAKNKHGLLSRLWNKLFGKDLQLTSNTRPDIEFIGVWDTVSAYVFPIDELSILWDIFIYPIRFPDQDLSPKVKHACHALSVDDERQTFHPVMWNEANESDNRIEQVWFPGVHSDVGGGYPRQSLSLIALDWMLSRVEAASTKDGLVFIRPLREQYHCQSDWNGLQHDSRSGLAMYFRYKPRDIAHICNDAQAGVTVKTPKLHRSVLERIKGRSTPYAPTGIPASYEVVTTMGAKPEYETAEQAKERAASLNYARDIIFWRRRLYIALLFSTLALLASRFFLNWDEKGICIGSACSIDPVMELVINSLPDIVTDWFEALRQNPGWLWGFMVLFTLLLTINNMAKKKTRAYAMCAWAVLKGKTSVPVWTGSFTSGLRQLADTRFKSTTVWSGATLIFLAVLYLLVAVMSGVAFHLRYTFGTLCENATNIMTPPVSLDIAKACYSTGIKIEKGRTYRFDVADTELHDGKKYVTDPDGFTAAALYPFVLFRRHIDAPWLKLYGKINNSGYEDFALGKGVSTYTARSDGELFLYVNDAVFGLLPEWDLPYKWARGENSGKVSVTVSKLEEEP